MGDESILPFQAQVEVADTCWICDFEGDANVDRGILRPHFVTRIASGANQGLIAATGTVKPNARCSAVPARIIKIRICPIFHWACRNMPFSLCSGGEKSDGGFPLDPYPEGDVFGLLGVVKKFARDRGAVGLYQS